MTHPPARRPRNLDGAAFRPATARQGSRGADRSQNNEVDQQMSAGCSSNSSLGRHRAPDLCNRGQRPVQILPEHRDGMVIAYSNQPGWTPRATRAFFGWRDRAMSAGPHAFWPDSFRKAHGALAGSAGGGHWQIPGPAWRGAGPADGGLNRPQPRLDGSVAGNQRRRHGMDRARLTNAAGERASAPRVRLRRLRRRAKDTSQPLDIIFGGRASTWGDGRNPCTRYGLLRPRPVGRSGAWTAVGRAPAHGSRRKKNGRSEATGRAPGNFRNRGPDDQPERQLCRASGWNPAYRNALVLALRARFSVGLVGGFDLGPTNEQDARISQEGLSNPSPQSIKPRGRFILLLWRKTRGPVPCGPPPRPVDHHLVDGPPSRAARTWCRWAGIGLMIERKGPRPRASCGSASGFLGEPRPPASSVKPKLHGIPCRNSF